MYNKIFLPVGLAKSVFKYMLTNDVRDDTLLESFLLYVDVRERQLIKKAISDHLLLKKHHHELWDIPLDCGLNSSPKVSNFQHFSKKPRKMFLSRNLFLS